VLGSLTSRFKWLTPHGAVTLGFRRTISPRERPTLNTGRLLTFVDERIRDELENRAGDLREAPVARRLANASTRRNPAVGRWCAYERRGSAVPLPGRADIRIGPTSRGKTPELSSVMLLRGSTNDSIGKRCSG